MLRIVCNLTTDAAGAATGRVGPAHGRIHRVEYIKGDFADTVDLAIRSGTWDRAIWVEENLTASKTICPREPIHSTAGVALTFDGTNPQVDFIHLCNEEIVVAVTNGGISKSGSFAIWVDE